jgi:RNA-directed DNA polymerase
MNPILSVRALAWRIGISAERLYDVANNIDRHYREKPQQETPDKIRILRIPDTELMDIQRRIKKNVLDPISLSDDVHGGVRGRSPRSNASQHLGARCVVTIDVRKFFDEVRHRTVYRMFRHELGFGRDVASILTRLTTLDSRIPQGAPTSTAVANLVLSIPVDGPLSKQKTAHDVRYTRFVDDLAFSGLNPRPIINMVANFLSRRRLKIHRIKKSLQKKSKLKITPRSRPQEVTGLLVNSAGGPSISRKRRDRVREAIFHLRQMSDSLSRDKAVQSLRGRIFHVQQFNPGAALRLKRYLDQTLAA